THTRRRAVSVLHLLECIPLAGTRTALRHVWRQRQGLCAPTNNEPCAAEDRVRSTAETRSWATYWTCTQRRRIPPDYVHAGPVDAETRLHKSSPVPSASGRQAK